MTHTPHATVPFVSIPLSNNPNVFALMDLADYDRLLTTGIKPPFFLNANRQRGEEYVRVSFPSVAGQLAVVARLVMDAHRGQIVTYRNRDRLDLRRANLAIQGGKAKGQAPWTGRTPKAKPAPHRPTGTAERAAAKVRAGIPGGS